jgi:hypothetical protein
MHVTNQSQPILLFLHIPRTAGTTLNRAARLKYNPKARIASRDFRDLQEFVDDVRSMPPEDLDRVRYYRGHFSYGLHTLLPKPARYLTVLRDPVDRVLSSYYFFIRELGSSDVSLEDFVRKGREGDPRLHIGWTDNVQIRMLAGDKGNPVRVPIGSCTPDMLERAKDRIASEAFVLAGLTERFDETMLLLKEKLGWKRCYYATFNVSKMRPAEIPGPTRDLIESYNELDLELYAFAERLLDGEIRMAGSSFFEDLEEFRSRNRIYNKTLQPLIHNYVRLSNKVRRSLGLRA